MELAHCSWFVAPVMPWYKNACGTDFVLAFKSGMSKENVMCANRDDREGA
jgi:hypothetical protein